MTYQVETKRSKSFKQICNNQQIVLRRQRQVNLPQSEAPVVHVESSRTVRPTQWDYVSVRHNKKKKTKVRWIQQKIPLNIQRRMSISQIIAGNRKRRNISKHFFKKAILPCYQNQMKGVEDHGSISLTNILQKFSIKYKPN